MCICMSTCMCWRGLSQHPLFQGMLLKDAFSEGLNMDMFEAHSLG